MAGNPSLPNPRETGLARLLGLESLPDADAFRRVLNERATDLGHRLADEAAANDDVQDAESALEYLDLRLSLLAGILPQEAVPAIRRAFAERVAGW